MRILLLLLVLFFLLHDQSISAAIVNPNETYTYEEMMNDIQEMEKTYPNKLSVTIIGETTFGHAIPAIKLGEGQEHLLLVGAHHGREWLTSTLLMVMLENYIKHYSKGEDVGTYKSDIFNEVSIWFVPMLNPDGVMIQQNNIPPFYADQILLMNEGDNNFSRWKASGIGIDLNRQYPAGWRKLGGPSTPSFQFYKGVRPIEAKEVRALTTLVDQIRPTISVAYHSTGQEIYWSFHNGKNKKRDFRIAQEISKLTGYKLGNPPKRATGGGFTDWIISKYHLPALTIEICPPMVNQAPPLSTFPEVWDRNKEVGLKLAEEIQRLHKND